MARPRVLSRSPLREAVIDIRVSPSAGFEPEALVKLHHLVADGYPNMQQQVAISGELHVQPDATVDHSSNSALLGVMFRSADELQVVQFRSDGFTFSRLVPYTTWEQVYPEAMRLWELYRKHVRPASVSRAAARYINDMRFPLPLELREYLAAPPGVPPDLPLEMVGFLDRVTLRDAEANLFVTIIQALGDVTPDDNASIILDIDAFKNLDGLSPDDSDALRRVFDQLRTIKNRVFFQSITEAAAGRFA